MEDELPAAHAHVMALTAYMTALTAFLRLKGILSADDMKQLEGAALLAIPASLKDNGAAILRIIVGNSESLFKK